MPDTHAGKNKIFLNEELPILEIYVLPLALGHEGYSIGDNPACATIAVGEILSISSNLNSASITHEKYCPHVYPYHQSLINHDFQKTDIRLILNFYLYQYH